MFVLLCSTRLKHCRAGGNRCRTRTNVCGGKNISSPSPDHFGHRRRPVPPFVIRTPHTHSVNTLVHVFRLFRSTSSTFVPATALAAPVSPLVTRVPARFSLVSSTGRCDTNSYILLLTLQVRLSVPVSAPPACAESAAALRFPFSTLRQPHARHDDGRRSRRH